MGLLSWTSAALKHSSTSAVLALYAAPTYIHTRYMAAAGSENPLKEDEKNDYILIQYHGEGTMGGGGEEQ
jgi:hypothetical protein